MLLWGAACSSPPLRASGARRFWPVRCGRIDVPFATRDRDQLWAEALSLYQAGEPWWLADSTEAIAARVEQEERYAEDTWTEIIGDYSEGKDEVSVSAILREAIGKPAEQWTQVDQNRVAGCLKARGGGSGCGYLRATLGHGSIAAYEWDTGTDEALIANLCPTVPLSQCNCNCIRGRTYSCEHAKNTLGQRDTGTAMRVIPMQKRDP